jgi:hypothetical protein
MNPLWTSRPELMSQFGIAESLCKTPHDVAVEMAALVEDSVMYPGGTVLETSIRGAKVVPPPEWTEVYRQALDRTSGIPGEKMKKKSETGALV